MNQIGPEFFKRDPVICAEELIGCTFRWDHCDTKIVETEAYTEFGDEACHTWSRPSSRDFIAKHDAGVAYVYLNYGVHWLFNIVCKGPDRSGFILLRAVEAMTGIERMMARRPKVEARHLGSGPGKLTKALAITADDHGRSFLEREGFGIYFGAETRVIAGPRIGISRALDKLWRFGDPDSTSLSRRF